MADNETSLSPTKGDVYLTIVLAVASMVFSVLYTATGNWPFEAPLWVLWLSSASVSLPLIWRRRYPSQVAWTQAVVFVTAQVFSAIEPGVTQIILFMGLYSVGAWQSNRRAAFISRTLYCLGIFLYLNLALSFQINDLSGMTALQIAAGFGINVLVNVAYFGGAWLFGNRAWNQRLLLAELRAANEEVRRQGERLADQALDLERVRIARELHDGVAHHIAGVGIHAAAARRSLTKNPDRAAESLKTIETSTRETVEELRALVYTLRDTGEARTEPTTKGNPSLGDLPELIESARGNGQRIEFRTIGEARPLTPITELSIYRVIQESLTNCSRYAGSGAEVEVRLRYGGADLEVEVSDSRSAGSELAAERPDASVRPEDSVHSEDPAGPEPQQAGLGLGIVGMRERMNALGGSLEAGPKSRGGWLVRARIPYPHTNEDVAVSASPAAASASPDASPNAVATNDAATVDVEDTNPATEDADPTSEPSAAQATDTRAKA
ncbi:MULTISPECIES: sensor histidine kinase [unclassified Brevibacterium]|uniref:sensor histidine kinase n=1 Tax=unclassified Brevibacterium TaxID=2614124 RepID=UPI001E506CF7|nr:MULTISPECIES: sensor histidine kinase [unclassified Brevibacterium]MCD1286851.1 sensor histidine kinase [Brevibacterium sp. CCUG 69071]MDK8433912.1 sensor histidine kinase [Brevibacterium sp. H-BE7]